MTAHDATSPGQGDATAIDVVTLVSVPGFGDLYARARVLPVAVLHGDLAQAESMLGAPSMLSLCSTTTRRSS